jgi:hypothetical protein
LRFGWLFLAIGMIVMLEKSKESKGEDENGLKERSRRFEDCGELEKCEEKANARAKLARQGRE